VRLCVVWSQRQQFGLHRFDGSDLRRAVGPRLDVDGYRQVDGRHPPARSQIVRVGVERALNVLARLGEILGRISLVEPDKTLEEEIG
jgi:hypothetical protein